MNNSAPQHNKTLSVEEVAEEYEEFLYIVSHDLKTPIRHIRDFTTLLIKSRSEKDLSEDEKEWVEYLNESLDHLADMQDALLSLSRIITKDFEYEHCNAHSIVELALSSLQDIVEQKEAALDIQDLPDFYGDADQIQCAFKYIIQNAVTFHKPGEKPQIIISGYEKDNQSVYEICDNGIGIKTEFRDDAFKLFRQLNRKDEYPGTGKGLALSKKIIERHNGKIWITEDQNQRTVIAFALPKQ